MALCSKLKLGLEVTVYATAEEREGLESAPAGRPTCNGEAVARGSSGAFGIKVAQ
jgi:hypothetical protein